MKCNKIRTAENNLLIYCRDPIEIPEGSPRFHKKQSHRKKLFIFSLCVLDFRGSISKVSFLILKFTHRSLYVHVSMYVRTSNVCMHVCERLYLCSLWTDISSFPSLMSEINIFFLTICRSNIVKDFHSNLTCLIQSIPACCTFWPQRG